MSMKIVLDLQGAQSGSRYRGIGRYTLSMAKAFVSEAAAHDVWLALNGSHEAAASDLLREFDGLVPPERILVYELPRHIAGCNPHSGQRMRLAEAAQAAFFAGQNADFVWHSSLFEGWLDDSTAALGAGGDDAKHGATLYDLIPLLNPGLHLHNAEYRLWYYRRLALLKRCGLLLAISESSRREAIDYLQLFPEKVVAVSGAADPGFRPLRVDELTRQKWVAGFGLARPFVLYAGGYDPHKNVAALIDAYAQLSSSLRSDYQLVLAGRCDRIQEQHLRSCGRRAGLSEGSMVFTGQLGDIELAQLYSNCKLFVAPSLHEGLGLPPLEAMSCGAAVIGSRSASLPEVIGREDALFDPRSISSMTAKLHQALTDEAFLGQLRAHAHVQARKFTWKACAGKALSAIESHRARVTCSVRVRSRERLIYVSPLPPLRSGISDYSARLLRDLATHYDIDVVVDQLEVVDSWTQANFPIRSLQWLESQSGSDVRVLYHMGNSPYHAHMFQLLDLHPGVVVLHDSFLGAVKNWMAQKAANPQRFFSALYQSHGYPALLHDLQKGRISTMDSYPANLEVLEKALGIIVHSDYAVKQVNAYYGPSAASKFMVVPFAKERGRRCRVAARRLLGIKDNDFVVCSFGMLAPTKLNHRLLAAWSQSSLAKDPHCHLFFVGENDGGEYGRELLRAIRSVDGRSRIHITGFVDADSYADYLAASDLAVQLRTASRAETSAAIFDVLAQGGSLIVNAHGPATELPDEVSIKLDDRFTDADLMAALHDLRNNADLREKLGGEAKRWIEAKHHPAVVAQHYYDAIEHFVRVAQDAQEQRLALALDRSSGARVEGDLVKVRALMRANRPRLDCRRLYVDVTATEVTTLHTGIERVVHGVLSQLLQGDSSGWRVEPVRLRNGCYVHATSFALQMIGRSDVELPEEEVQPRAGDVLLGLDWVADLLPANRALLDSWRVRGARMFFVVYDLLPVRMPRWFPEGIADMHAKWLQCIGDYADGLISISKSVAQDARDWFSEHPPHRQHELKMGYFYPGSDIASARPSTGLPQDAPRVLAKFREWPSFLMVGTIEPRKGHAFVLDTFDRLWKEGANVCLVVIGKQGWMSEGLADRMRRHPRAGQQLIWLQCVSDEYLDHIFEAAHALIAASEGEGFGLPLVEAAQRGLPVIARDIPVFREVSSAYATYFDGLDPDSLLVAVRKVVDGGEHLRVREGEVVLTWQATVRRLRDMLSDASHPQWLEPWHAIDGSYELP
jgi:glycosyltransferase involved in cell wall biosynthesis